VAGLAAGAAEGIVVAAYEGLVVDPMNGLLLGFLLGLVLGLVVRYARGLTIGHAAGIVFGFGLLGVAVSEAHLRGDLVLGLVLLVSGAIPIMIVAALAVQAVGFTPPETPAYADLRLRGRTRLLARKLTRCVGSNSVLRFVPGFAAGLLFGTVLGAVGKVPNGLLSGPVFALLLGSATWLAVGLIEWAETPLTDDRPRTPITTFRHDLRLVYFKSLVGGFAFGIAFWLQNTLSGRGAIPTGPVIPVTVTIALGVGFHQLSGRYLATVLALRIRRQLPLRPLSFLNDAHRLGIIRQNGPVYQFRHARLQDHLAQKFLKVGTLPRSVGP
jgi:hypothetical protein